MLELVKEDHPLAVGDRVRVTGYHEDVDGRVGKVVGFDDNGVYIEVDLDATEDHPARRGWLFTPDELECV